MERCYSSCFSLSSSTNHQELLAFICPSHIFADRIELLSRISISCVLTSTLHRALLIIAIHYQAAAQRINTEQKPFDKYLSRNLFALHF